MEKESIKCTVGILTYNSGEFLERCLKSLEGFSEIIISDGGSTDKTLEIAQKYDCKIIKQSKQGVPINDFSLERNQILANSTNDWFFYLDSDEIISLRLKEEIREICNKEEINLYVYKVPYKIVSKDLSIIYKSFKTYYQTRFFNKKCEAKFIRKVHEKIAFDENKYKTGALKGFWYVPLDVQLDFKTYKQKVDFRIKIMAEERRPQNFFQYLKFAFLDRIRDISKNLIKLVYLRIKYKKGDLTPVKYEFYKVYSQWIFLKEFSRQYWKNFKI